MNWGLAKVGLILTMIGQVFISIAFLAGAVLAGSLGGPGFILLVPFFICIGALALTIHGYRKIKKIERGIIPLSKGYLYFVGVLALGTTLIGGILVLVGVAQVHDTGISRDRYRNYRQGDYRGHNNRHDDYRDLRRRRRQDDYRSSRHDDY